MDTLEPVSFEKIGSYSSRWQSPCKYTTLNLGIVDGLLPTVVVQLHSMARCTYFAEMQGRRSYVFTTLSGNSGVRYLIDELLFERHALLAKVRMVSSSLISACASDESLLSYPSFQSSLFQLAHCVKFVSVLFVHLALTAPTPDL